MTTFSHDCPHCDTKRVAFSIKAQEVIPSKQELWNVFAQCGNCGFCVVAVFRSISGHDPLTRFATTPTDFKLMEFFPKPQEPSAPDHLPENVKRFFLQGVENVARNQDAAGAMFRKSLDVALKVKCPEATGRLVDRINRAVELGTLTSELGEWAHQIRLEGNEATHGDDPYTPEQAAALHQFTMLVLLYLFTLPGMLVESRQTSSQPLQPEEEAAEG